MKSSWDTFRPANDKPWPYLIYAVEVGDDIQPHLKKGEIKEKITWFFKCSLFTHLWTFVFQLWEEEGEEVFDCVCFPKDWTQTHDHLVFQQLTACLDPKHTNSKQESNPWQTYGSKCWLHMLVCVGPILWRTAKGGSWSPEIKWT